MNPSVSVTKALVELGDEVSRNLSFAYKDDTHVSYGEETITENCLLSLKRKLGELVQIETFSKSSESKTTGADWEWHFVGSHLVASFRVQAKRVNRNGGISGILRQSKTALSSQADLLISSANQHNMIPLHCFYCAEEHRKIWISRPAETKNRKPFLNGCLIADATIVRNMNPKNLAKIEHMTVPWHFLFSETMFEQNTALVQRRFAAAPESFETVTEIFGLKFYQDLNLPTESYRVPNLNRAPKVSPQQGIRSLDQYQDDQISRRETASERKISRVMEIDVRDPDLFAKQFR